MSSNHQNKKVVARVSLEASVMAYLGDLAAPMGMSRSWVLHTIVYDYAKMAEKKNLVPLAARLEVHRSKQVIIKA